MEVTDKKYAAEIEAKMAKEDSRLKKKRAKGLFGVFVPMVDHLKNRQKPNAIMVEDVLGQYGRARNRIYRLKNEEYVLFKKFKNVTKAKKFMGRI